LRASAADDEKAGIAEIGARLRRAGLI